MKYIIILFVSLSFQTFGQSKFESQLLSSLDLIYQMDFDKASEAIDRFYSYYPDNTARLLLKAYYTRWKNYPIVESDTQLYNHYTSILDSAKSEAKEKLSANKNDPEQSYYYMAAHIMQAELYATNGHMVKASFEGKSAFSYIKKGFEWCETYPEFLTTTGLYNYYIEYYREKSFFYQSLLWPFSKGDKMAGLEYLKKASKSAVFTKVEAIQYLAHLNFKTEVNPQAALGYIEKLVTLYPKNSIFRDLHVELLLELKQFAHAELSLNKLDVSGNEYLIPRKRLYESILKLEMHNDLNEAKKGIIRSIKEFQSLELEQDHHLSLAYYYLSAIEKRLGNNDLSEDAFSKSDEYAKYPYVIKKLENSTVN
ncbi:hypothetical protein [Fulvivirga lutea]|uniref:Tetratricopeptide repeat protein n=1 Tax=Fulvivirga lutea TaxID=2810512 RepID=A0A974ZZE2_9BACT|nr:hypothetical protein [Fulvivirga lutea]QSE95991.1 hypothetical protein JR347_10215 [Fulvivirga lutea]